MVGGRGGQEIKERSKPSQEDQAEGTSEPVEGRRLEMTD
jgi:hypothetical protein